MIQGISRTLYEEVLFDRASSSITTKDWRSYLVLKFGDTIPEIVSILIDIGTRRLPAQARLRSRSSHPPLAMPSTMPPASGCGRFRLLRKPSCLRRSSRKAEKWATKRHKRHISFGPFVPFCGSRPSLSAQQQPRGVIDLDRLREIRYDTSIWWDPGRGIALPPSKDYDDASGQLRLLNKSGEVETKGHAFFTALGSNGRACVTCHQPSNAMSLSLDLIRDRWAATKGKDPLFAAIDGSNCPDLPQDKQESHSLLLERGLIRIAPLPWPPQAQAGFPHRSCARPNRLQQESRFHLRLPPPARRRQPAVHRAAHWRHAHGRRPRAHAPVAGYFRRADA